MLNEHSLVCNVFNYNSVLLKLGFHNKLNIQSKSASKTLINGETNKSERIPEERPERPPHNTEQDRKRDRERYLVAVEMISPGSPRITFCLHILIKISLL